MPNIIVKNEYGEDEVYNDVNTVKFLDESGNVVSYKYNTGEIYPRPTGNRVRFIDHDGFVISTIYVDTGDTVYYPDVSPTREGFTFVGWNYSLEDLSNISHDVDVGAMYVPDSIAGSGATNATTIRIRLSVTGNTFNFYVFSNGVNKFLVDWGDGTTNTYSRTSTSGGTLSPSHTYASAGGEYTITLVRTEGTAEYWLGRNSKTGTSSSITFNQSAVVIHVSLSTDISLIPNFAFYNCYSLQSVVIPDSVTSIGSNAFYSCYSLQSVVIPDGVTSIGTQAFYYCHSLQSIVIPDSVTSIGGSAFYYCYSLQSVVIPDSVTSIESGVFNNCLQLQSVVIPDSVTSIGSNAFAGCYSLQSVVIPDSVTSIGSSAFSSCYSLQSIVIPDSVTSIGGSAFYYCYSLQSVVIPDSVTSIGSSAFSNCRALNDVYVYATVPPTLGSSNFSNSIESRRIHVPIGTESAYKAATNWSALANYIVGDL